MCWIYVGYISNHVYKNTKYPHVNIDGLVQDCSNSIANALELLQSCTKPLICIGQTLEVLDIFNHVMLSRNINHKIF